MPAMSGQACIGVSLPGSSSMMQLLTMYRSQRTYPTSAAEYDLEREIGKGACGTVSPWSLVARHSILRDPSMHEAHT